MTACGRLPHNLPIRKFNGFRPGPDFPTPRGAFTKPPPPTGRVCRRWGWRKAVVVRGRNFINGYWVGGRRLIRNIKYESSFGRVINEHVLLWCFSLAFPSGKEAPPLNPIPVHVHPLASPSGLILGPLPPRRGVMVINDFVTRGPVTQVGYGGPLALLVMFW